MVRGGGILFFRSTGRATEVLLGKRSYDPDKNCWSIPGGRMNPKDMGDFGLCAARETCEEFFNNQPAAFSFLTEQIDRQRSSRFLIPFLFHFQTFIVGNLPLPEVSFNHEFLEVKWFPVDQLPPNTLPVVVLAIKKMKRKGWNEIQVLNADLANKGDNF